MKLNEVLNTIKKENLTEAQIFNKIFSESELKISEVLEVCKEEFPERDYKEFRRAAHKSYLQSKPYDREASQFIEEN